jgi:uncharacterized membrane protein HdeD (DUF308 family)
MMQAMKSAPTPRSTDAARKAHNELLQKGILIALIGLAVLIAPAFMAASPVREVIASSAVVGWFALVLGAAFVVLYLRRRASGDQRS